MKKPTRLGMGLSALMGDSQPPPPAATPSGAPRTLPIEALEPSPFQARTTPDPAALAELAASIQEHGILQPILVRPKPGAAGRFQILGGERRWRAAQQAKLHDVPVVIRDLDDRAAMAAGLVENLQREDLNALEEAEGYARLISEFGLKQEGLGQAVGKSRSHVANLLRLLDLPQSVRDHVAAGHLTMGHARALITAVDPATLAETVIARGLSVRQTEALARAAKRSTPARAAVRPPIDADLAALERQLSDSLGLKVAIRHAGGGGSVTVTYSSLDQLDMLCQRLSGEGF